MNLLDASPSVLAVIVVGTVVWKVIRFFLYRDTERRKEEIRVRDIESESLRKQMDWMQKKYDIVNNELDSLYGRYRKLEEEKVEMIKENNELHLALKIAEYDRCERPDDECIKRLPARQKCRLRMLLSGHYEDKILEEQDVLDIENKDEDVEFRVHKVPD